MKSTGVCFLIFVACASVDALGATVGERAYRFAWGHGWLHGHADIGNFRSQASNSFLHAEEQGWASRELGGDGSWTVNHIVIETVEHSRATSRARETWFGWVRSRFAPALPQGHLLVEVVVWGCLVDGFGNPAIDRAVRLQFESRVGQDSGTVEWSQEIESVCYRDFVDSMSEPFAERFFSLLGFLEAFPTANPVPFRLTKAERRQYFVDLLLDVLPGFYGKIGVTGLGENGVQGLEAGLRAWLRGINESWRRDEELRWGLGHYIEPPRALGIVVDDYMAHWVATGDELFRKRFLVLDEDQGCGAQ